MEKYSPFSLKRRLKCISVEINLKDMARDNYIGRLLKSLKDNELCISTLYIPNKNTKYKIRFSNGLSFSFSWRKFPIFHKSLSSDRAGKILNPRLPFFGMMLLEVKDNTLILKERLTPAKLIYKETIVFKNFSENKEEIEDLLDMVELMNINYVVFQRYMEEIYGSKENFPLDLENVEIGLKYRKLYLGYRCDFILPHKFGKTFYFYKMDHGAMVRLEKNQINDILIIPLGLIEGFTDFTKVEFFPQRLNDKYLFYKNGDEEYYIEIGEFFEKRKNILLGFTENIHLYNESVKNFKDPLDAYMDYIGKIIKPHSGKKRTSEKI